MFESGQTILNIYFVEKLLGAGGSGEVFLVRRIPDNMPYAVKVIHSGKVKSLQLRQDLLREMRISRILGEHPHIVPSRFFRIIDGSLAVFSDYVSGGTLHTWIRSGKIRDKAHLLDIAIQIAWGLDVAHAGGIIHKDIKPANILMEPDGRARIADFGLIRGMTPAYCAPEQVTGKELTPAADIWSWALVVMSMWFGENKWMLGPQAPQALEHLYSDNGPFGAAPNTLISLLSTCVRNDPAARPSTALYIAENLKVIYESETGVCYPRPDPPELTSSASASTHSSRKSMIDGISMNDPHEMLKEIQIRIDSVDMDVGSLIPEMKNPPETFEDDLHVYLVIEDILRRVSAEGDVEWLELLADTLKRKAFILFDSGDLSAAIATHEEAIVLLKEIILWHERPDLWKKLAEHWSDVSFCHLQCSRPENAVTSIQNAARAMDRVPDSLQDNAFFADKHTLVTNQAIICASTGDIDAATQYFQDALTVLDHIDAQKHPELVLRCKAQSEFNLGTHFEKTGQPETGIAHFYNAVKLQDDLLKRDADFHDQLFMATICQNLAVCLAGLNRVDAADFFFQKAGDRFEKLHSESDHHFVQQKYALFLKNYGHFHCSNRDVEKAVELAEQALAIMTKVFEKDGTLQYSNRMADIYFNLAHYYDLLNLDDKAQECVLNYDKYKLL